MAKSFKSLLEVMVPQSAKKGSDIDNQWLEPASYDKKMMKAMIGEPDNIYDQEAPENQADNFKAQDLVKKNRKLPLRQGGLSEAEAESAGNLSVNDHVNEAYEVEALDLLEEIMDLIEESDEHDEIYWRNIASSLKEARDCLIRCCVNEDLNESVEELNESFKQGNFKLHDGSTIRLSKDDAKALNVAVSGTKSQKEMLADVTKNEKEFKQFLNFARNLKEDYTGTLDALLENLSPDQLQDVIDQELSEGDIWNSVAGGAKAGAKVGKAVGAATGMAGGAAYGAAAGGAIGVGKKVSDIIKRRKAQKSMNEAKDPNNEKESILGTSAPAMDSDPNNAKPRPKTNIKVQESAQLDEISKETAEKYVKRATGEHTMANMARRSLEGQPSTDGGKALEYWKRQEKNRKKGISRAFNTIDKDNKK